MSLQTETKKQKYKMHSNGLYSVLYYFSILADHDVYNFRHESSDAKGDALNRIKIIFPCILLSIHQFEKFFN
jgi:hypothetical protein